VCTGCGKQLRAGETVFTRAGGRERFCGNCKPSKGKPDSTVMRELRIKTRSVTDRSCSTPVEMIGVCGECEEELGASWIHVGNERYHTKCLVCSKCGQNLAAGRIYSHRGRRYCRADYPFKLFQPGEEQALTAPREDEGESNRRRRKRARE
jgi:hypothetical protein